MAIEVPNLASRSGDVDLNKLTGFLATLAASGETITSNRRTSSYTLTLTDAGKAVEMNVESANDLTVPPASSVAFPDNAVIEVAQYGAGQTTVVAGAGVTIRSRNGLKLAGQYAGAALRRIGTDEWWLIGDTTT